MRRIFMIFALTVISVLSFSGIGKAVPVNPDSTTFGDDDGSKFFMPALTTFNIQVHNALSGVPMGSDFGFYFYGDETNLISLFGPTNIAPGEVAAVDFSLGAVLDLTSSAVHGTFTPKSDAIGFYYTIDPLNVYGSKATFYSDDSLNGGLDLFATFPVLGTTDTFLIGVGSTDAIYFDVSSGLTPTTVPEPSTVLLIGLGLVSLAAFRYRDGLSAKARN